MIGQIHHSKFVDGAMLEELLMFWRHGCLPGILVGWGNKDLNIKGQLKVLSPGYECLMDQPWDDQMEINVAWDLGDQVAPALH